LATVQPFAVRPLGPVGSEELGWGLGVLVRGVRGPTWPLGRWALGSVAGDPDRHRGWLLSAPPPYRRLPAGGRLRPRVSSAHRPFPQL
jgi:hypothetical protein